MSISNKRILYLGTPDISALVLEGLITAGYQIVGVVAQPDQPLGRKKIIEPVPTKKVALKYNIPVFQPQKIRNDYEFVKELQIDLIICFSYGQIIPQGLLDIPPLGSINLHGSLLPKYRGASPIQAALINRDKETGITLMEMIDKMDAGKMYAKEVVPILANDNYTSLSKKMGEAALRLILRSLPLYLENKLPGVKQDEELVTFTRLLKAEDEHLNLELSKEEIVGWILALSDEPGAYLIFNNEKLKIYDAKIVSEEVLGDVGEIVKANKNGVYLQCKNGLVSLTKLQKPGKKVLGYRDFLNGERNLLNARLV